MPANSRRFIRPSPERCGCPSCQDTSEQKARSPSVRFDPLGKRAGCPNLIASGLSRFRGPDHRLPVDCPMSELGHSRRFRDGRGMSGLPQTADISGPGRHFAFVPIAVIGATGPIPTETVSDQDCIVVIRCSISARCRTRDARHVAPAWPLRSRPQARS
jgi:hypothetical protein